MSVERVEALVVGAGQAGVAMSEHLSRNGIPHLVLERDRIAERWRSGRWDSLVANGPAWHDRFPGLEFADDPDVFVPKEAVADYFVAYAEKIAAPIRSGVEVTRVERNAGRPGFRVETSAGAIEARYVVAATGPFQRPVFPRIVPEDAGITQMHSAAYRNPDQLPAGAVLVVGAGASGAQIAEELLRAGRRVYISVGPHDRPPRRYRGRDNVWWLGAPAAAAEQMRRFQGRRQENITKLKPAARRRSAGVAEAGSGGGGGGGGKKRSRPTWSSTGAGRDRWRQLCICASIAPAEVATRKPGRPALRSTRVTSTPERIGAAIFSA